MRYNQCLPTIFKPHKDWIFEALQANRTPKAWILKNDQWELQSSDQVRGLIEHFEYVLYRQDNIGVLRFTGTIDASKENYSILYLYDGVQFSHTIFQPLDGSKSISSNFKDWWIEPWSIDHMLSK